MSALDMRLLEAAGLSASKAAKLLGKSRQAVSKGIRGNSDYFSESDLKALDQEIGRQSTFLQARFQHAVSQAFGDLANRLRASAATSGLFEAIDRSTRLWLILPDFVQGKLNQPESYRPLLERIKARSRDGDERPEVIAFCDSAQGRITIDVEFDESWFRSKRVALLQCDLIAMLPPMVVVDPQGDPQCYILSENGFVGLAPHEAAGRVSAIAAEVAKKICPAGLSEGGERPKPLNLIAVGAEQLLAANENNLVSAA